MSDANKLRGDVKWWIDEVSARQKKGDTPARVKDAIDTLARRQEELTRAERQEQEEAKRASEKKAA